jgi:hypothetical protein
MRFVIEFIRANDAYTNRALDISMLTERIRLLEEIKP